MKLNACAHEFWVQVYFKIEVSGIGTGLLLLTVHRLEKMLTVATGPQIFVTVKFYVCVAALVPTTKFGHKMFSFFLFSFKLTTWTAKEKKVLKIFCHKWLRRQCKGNPMRLHVQAEIRIV